MSAPPKCRPDAQAIPVVDRNKCEGKGDCVRVCPKNVFEVRTIAPEDKTELSLVGRLKSWAHGGKTAYTPRADACEACGLCIPACPEKAIRIRRRPA